MLKPGRAKKGVFMKYYIKMLGACALLCTACQNNSNLSSVDVDSEGLQQKVSFSKRYSAFSLLDRQDRKILNKSSPRTLKRMQSGTALTINDLIRLSQSGINDQTILAYLKETRATYELSQMQIKRMQDAGVSPRVVNYIIETGR